MKINLRLKIFYHFLIIIVSAKLVKITCSLIVIVPSLYACTYKKQNGGMGCEILWGTLKRLMCIHAIFK